MSSKINIIVPVYKEIASELEIISLEQLFKILGNKYSITLVCPQTLKLMQYEYIAKKYDVKLNVVRFPDENFTGIRSYNKLMLNPDFYKKFLTYEYILIYQLDCYVFKDELSYWCNSGYDYIGAPWLTYRVYNLSKFEKIKFFIKQFLGQKIGEDVKDFSLEYKVGNGGFSLRRTAMFYNILNNLSQDVIKKYYSDSAYSLHNEDTFWSYEVNKKRKRINIPSYRIATRFSLELNPDIGMRMNNQVLPFGCHAWHKNLKFWGKYINIKS